MHGVRGEGVEGMGGAGGREGLWPACSAITGHCWNGGGGGMGGSVGFPNTHKLIVVGLDRLFIHHAAVLVVPLAEVLVHGLRRGLCVRVQRPQGSVFLAKGLQLGFESTCFL